MQIFRNENNEGFEPLSFDIKFLDYDLTIIIFNAYKIKLEETIKKRKLLRDLYHETDDVEERNQLYHQVEYLMDLESKLQICIEKMEEVI